LQHALDLAHGCEGGGVAGGLRLDGQPSRRSAGARVRGVLSFERREPCSSGACACGGDAGVVAAERGDSGRAAECRAGNGSFTGDARRMGPNASKRHS
jgi:hypothetical protein